MRTYGKAWFEKNRWQLDVEPHVAVRIRRVFPALVGKGSSLSVANNESNAADLLWVLSRYPLEVNKADRARLEQSTREHAERSHYFTQLLSGKREARRFDLAVPARGYQQVAADLAYTSKGLLIADDLGIGKTATSICLLAEPETLPALVVTMTHLPRQWERELKKFAPQLQTHVIRSRLAYDLTEDGIPDVIISNYHKLEGWAEMLAGGTIRTVIFDEMQELRRGPGSNKYSAAEAICDGAMWRVGLTATPIYNYGVEFFHVLNLLRPDALGSFAEFVAEWCVGSDEKATIRDPKAFGAFLRESGLMIRRTRKEVKRELPPLSRITHYVDTDEAALEEVSRDVAQLAQFVLQQGGGGFDKMRAGGELDWRMRQATGLAKAPHVAMFVKFLLESEQNVVLYGWHHAVYLIWQDVLKEFNPVLYTGQESTNQKEAAREAFMNGSSRVLIMSLRAGAGLDGLQHACRTLVFGELDWSPGVHEQCEGRLERDGQPDPVASYFCLSSEGSDPIISDVLGVKTGQIRGVRDPNADLVEKLQPHNTDNIKRLAELVLKKRGIPIPKAAS